MSLFPRCLLASALVLALAGCGQKADDSTPLSYVPADTPFVIASLEPLPEAAMEDRFRVIQPMWKAYFTQLGAMLDEAKSKAKTDDERQGMDAARVILDEFRDRDSLAKWKELGFTSQSRSALYGIGLAPVMRLELADPEAFRALITRLETKIGKPLPKAMVAGQEYWRLGPPDAPLGGALAIEGKQVVLTLIPKNASEASLKKLLGVERPAKNMADGEALRQLAKERGYLLQGLGYLDSARTFDLLAGQHEGSDAEFAAALQLPTTPIDPVCRSEIAAMAAHFPRATFGYTKFETTEQSFAASFELDDCLRQQLAKVIVPVPGMGANDNSLFDVTLSLPLLKWKDFWTKQADAASAAPYKCASLAPINQQFAEMKQNLDRTVPPPLSNLLGLRATLDTMVLSKEGMPDPAQSAGRVLVATDNPMLMVSMAQLGAPPLKDLKLNLDGKPVPLPAGAMPMPLPAFVAANNSALAMGVGNTAEGALPGYLSASGGDGKTLLHMHFSGQFYAIYGQLIGSMMAKAGGEHQELFELQRQMYQRYAEWMTSTDFSLGLDDHGIAMKQSVKFNPPK